MYGIVLTVLLCIIDILLHF